MVILADYLSTEFGIIITPGFEALAFTASRGIEDIYELTYIRKDGSRFSAVVSMTALRDSKDFIIGDLLIGTDNTARKVVEAKQRKLARLRDQQFYTRSLIESNVDAIAATDPSEIITTSAIACEMFRADNYDLVLMDRQMPVRDGLTATRTIRARKLANKRRPTPIIVPTASALDGEHETCLAAGATAF